VVWTGGLFDQWVERVQNELGLDPRWIGKVKGGVRTYGPVTIGMQQTIAKMRERGKLPDRHDDFFERWGLVGCDEVHRFAAKTFFDAVDPFTAKYRIGVSDDERRADRKDFMIGDLFGGVAAEVTKEELVGKGRILDVAMRIVPTGWRPTSKNAEAAEIVGEDDVDRSDTHALLAEMGGDDVRNAIVVEHAARYVQEGHQVLVFTLRREHVLRLAQLLGSRGLVAGLLVGGADYQVEFRDALARLKSGEMRVAVGMVQAVGTGIDLPALARGVVGMPIAGNKSLLRQVSGRICRASSGKSAEIAYLYDEEVFPDHFGKLSKASVAPLVWCAESGTWVSPKEWRAGQRVSRQLELSTSRMKMPRSSPPCRIV